MDVLTTAIGIGLVISLMFSEMFGLAAGGMVVPGYFALYLNQPISVAITLTAALVTFWLVHALSSVVIIYGKRRTVMMILVGFLIGAGLELVPIGAIQTINTMQEMHTTSLPDYTVIGYIIPGLLAIWIDRQGLVETVSVLLTASVVVRMTLIVVGMEGLA